MADKTLAPYSVCFIDTSRNDLVIYVMANSPSHAVSLATLDLAAWGVDRVIYDVEVSPLGK